MAGINVGLWGRCRSVGRSVTAVPNCKRGHQRFLSAASVLVASRLLDFDQFDCSYDPTRGWSAYGKLFHAGFGAVTTKAELDPARRREFW